MAILGLILIGLGIVLIAIGTYVSLVEWNRTQRQLADARAHKGVVTEAAGAGEVLTGLAKLADALKQHRLGMQLIIIGIGLVILGGIVGGIAGLGN